MNKNYMDAYDPDQNDYDVWEGSYDPRDFEDDDIPQEHYSLPPELEEYFSQLRENVKQLDFGNPPF